MMNEFASLPAAVDVAENDEYEEMNWTCRNTQTHPIQTPLCQLCIKQWVSVLLRKPLLDHGLSSQETALKNTLFSNSASVEPVIRFRTTAEKPSHKSVMFKRSWRGGKVLKYRFGALLQYGQLR